MRQAWLFTDDKETKGQSDARQVSGKEHGQDLNPGLI